MFTLSCRRLCATLLLAIAVSACFKPRALAYTPHFDQEESENIAVYENTAKAVVTINALVDGHPSSGAGAIIDASGIILTSSHVVGTSNQIFVSLQDGRKAVATLLGRAGAKYDLALLKVTLQDPLPVLKLGDSSQVRVGQKVLAIGNPYGFERTLTRGIVSRLDIERNRIQTDAAINPGNSGGPLLDNQGYLIGINQSIYNPDGNHSNIGLGFAIPVNSIKTFIHDIAVSTPLPTALAAVSKEPVVRFRTQDTTKAYENVSMLLMKVSAQP